MSLLLTGMLLCLAPDMKGNETAIEAKAITRDVVKRHVGELLNMGDTVRMSLRIEAHFVKDGQKWYNEVTAFNIVSFR